MDGSDIPIDPMDAFASGSFNKVPILIGTVLDEALLFIYQAANTSVSETDYLALLSLLFLYLAS